MILSIDTTADLGSIALADRHHVLEEVPMHSPDGFAHLLFGQIRALLDRHTVALCDLECIVSAAGPGSFTGVRVCMTAAKGLAETLHIPMTAVSNLQAVAFFGGSALRAVVLDARRGDIFGAVYDGRGQLIQDETVTNFSSWLNTLPEGVEFVSQTPSLFLQHLQGSRFEGAPFVEAPRMLAGAIARIGASDPSRWGSPVSFDANYVRRSDAELFWTDR